MRRFVVALSLAVGSLVTLLPTAAFADTCVTCGSGSTNGCQQCRMPGGDSSEARKACEKKGCKITGTASCSTAANVKVCTRESAAPIITAQRDSLECAKSN